jgi:hypothetical protein
LVAFTSTLHLRKICEGCEKCPSVEVVKSALAGTSVMAGDFASMTIR